MAKIRPYAKGFSGPSDKELYHFGGSYKEFPSSRAEVDMPEYPDSVEGLMRESNEQIASTKRSRAKKNSRYN